MSNGSPVVKAGYASQAWRALYNWITGGEGGYRPKVEATLTGQEPQVVPLISTPLVVGPGSTVQAGTIQKFLRSGSYSVVVIGAEEHSTGFDVLVRKRVNNSRIDEGPVPVSTGNKIRAQSERLEVDATQIEVYIRNNDGVQREYNSVLLILYPEAGTARRVEFYGVDSDGKPRPVIVRHRGNGEYVLGVVNELVEAYDEEHDAMRVSLVNNDLSLAEPIPTSVMGIRQGVVLRNIEQDGDVNASGTDYVDITATDGFIGTLQHFSFEAPAIAGATEGTHSLRVGIRDVTHRNERILEISGPHNTALSFSSLYIPKELTITVPSYGSDHEHHEKASILMQMLAGGLVQFAGSAVRIRCRYYNQTNGTQTGKRRYILRWHETPMLGED